MEQYHLEVSDETQPAIQYGYYVNKVSEKHKKDYGETGAANIRNNIVDTFTSLEKQILNSEKNNNTLLVGKVQSGKTSNLELLTALAFDNGYNLLIIYGGYDNSLLKQTTERFRNTFDSPEQPNFDEGHPAIFTTADDKNIIGLEDDGILEELLDCKPVIFVSMKRPQAMRKINSILEKIDVTKLRAFIIDDEGDQASLNIAKDKKNDASGTYQQIKDMKTNLHNPLYLSVTATPQANIYLDDYSAVKPDSIHLIQPGYGYTGGNIYHLDDDKHIIEIIDEDLDAMTVLSESLKAAIRYFIVASAIKNKTEKDASKKYSDMIIHTVREVNSHKGIFMCVNSFLNNYKSAFKNKSDDIELYYREVENSYDLYLEDEYKKQFPFESLKEEIKDVILKVSVILKNSEGKYTQGNENLKRYKIYIGGDLLQRGLTFKNLITTYFTRWAKTGGNMDTNLQRARWFGYRQKYINLCKIFTTQEIAIEFSNLAEMENNIWEQFAEVENGDLAIEDIIIEAENTKQSPTSKNKASFKKLAFRQQWKKQRNIVFNEKDVESNNEIVKKFISNHTWYDTTVGSAAGNITARLAKVTAQEIKMLLENLSAIFETEDESIRKHDLLKIFTNQNVNVLLMRPDEKAISRSLYLNSSRIKALQEGRRQSDEAKSSYLGDAKVIINSTTDINIQIYYVEPCYKENGNRKVLKNITQYVFAFYMPGEKTYFVKDKND